MTNKLRTAKLPSGYGMVQQAVMRYDKLSKEAKALYALLASYLGQAEFCFPSIETQANDLGCSMASIKRYQNELVDEGLLVKDKLYPGDKLKTHNKYSLMYIADGSQVNLRKAHPRTLAEVAHEPHNSNTLNSNTKSDTSDKSSVSRSIDNPDVKTALKIWGMLTGQSVLDQPITVQRNVQATINKYSLSRLLVAMHNMCEDSWTIENNAFNLNRLVKPDKRSMNMNKFAKAKPFGFKQLSESESAAYFDLQYSERKAFIETTKKSRIEKGEIWL